MAHNWSVVDGVRICANCNVHQTRVRVDGRMLWRPLAGNCDENVARQQDKKDGVDERRARRRRLRRRVFSKE